MASVKEIRDHMNSVAQTQKITNAMYMISSTKMERARRELEKTRPYFTKLREEVQRIFLMAGKDVQSRYFYPSEKEEDIEGTYGVLVITADKGLAGSYNQNVIKETLRLRKNHPDMKLYVVGEYGRHYFMKQEIAFEKSFLYTAQQPTLQRAREITQVMLGQYDEGKLVKLFVVYTDMKNQMTEEAILYRLLPLRRGSVIGSGRESGAQALQERAAAEAPFEFLPNVTEVLENAMRSVVAGFIYSALVDSFCSEQNARMQAMKSANDNAEEILGELSIEYNRVRQAAITQEITEVSAGAKAQKKKAR